MVHAGKGFADEDTLAQHSERLSPGSTLHWVLKLSGPWAENDSWRRDLLLAGHQPVFAELVEETVLQLPYPVVHPVRANEKTKFVALRPRKPLPLRL